MDPSADWYKNWFNSPYYHVLYKHRDFREAELFMDKLMETLHLEQGSKVLDLACGKGRHAIYLSKKGFDVTGIDLSEENIKTALEFENNNLAFYVQDMRLPFRINYYHLILNLFTSFGYFDNDADNARVVKAVHSGLVKKGLFVLDYFNAELIQRALKPHFEETIDGIQFTIRKRIEGAFILKQIHINDKGREYDFCEKVRLLSADELRSCLLNNGFTIVQTYGDYNLGSFDASASPRLIFIAEKKQTNE